MPANYGGNQVSSIDLNSQGTYHFANNTYSYYYSSLNADEELIINQFKSFTVYIISMTESTEAQINHLSLKSETSYQIENDIAHLRVSKGKINLLVAGTSGQVVTDKIMKVTELNDIKKVVKPWGYELWITGEHVGYAFKKIFIKAKTKTSLQYHQLKQETNVLFDGLAYLHYKNNPSVDNNSVGNDNISKVEISPISSIDIWPNTIHRLEAISDIVLYEVSTPHLDDVIRISDDNHRPDGRIESEHSRKS
jgi:hypothetical protein